MANEDGPFAVDVFHVEGHVIAIESYRDGQVSAHRQRNGSGSYNAKKYTAWVVTADGKRFGTYTSRFGRAKWEAYEAARQALAPTEDAYDVRDPATRRVVGRTRFAIVVRNEMKITREVS